MVKTAGKSKRENRMDKRFVYMDYAATTPVSKDVFREMEPYFCDIYGNASAIYGVASEARKAIDKARNEIAMGIGARKEEIFFTSGGTESDNWIIRSVAEQYGSTKGKHIITSCIEHHAVLHTCQHLEKEGFEVTYLSVDEDGKIDLEELRKSIRDDTILVSIMTANNEIGTIEPIEKITELVHKAGCLFHTDAVQAVGHIPMDVEKMGIDFLSASGHKIYGPKGIGFAYIRRDKPLLPFMLGGSQERGKRAGTLNTPGIVGMAKALTDSIQIMQKENERQIRLRDYMIDRLLCEVHGTKLNGDREARLANNINISIDKVEGESVLLLLNQKGICASSGSACTTTELDPSHVLLAIGRSKEQARSSIRFTLGRETTLKDIDYAVESIKEVVEQLQRLRA